MSKLKIYSESKHALPNYAKEGDSGMDLAANLEGSIFIHPLKRVLIPTGLFVQLQEGYEAQVRPKSGNSLNKQFDVKLGTVDSNYRGEIGVIVQNISDTVCEIKDGDYVAQLVIAQVDTAELVITDSLEELNSSNRGTDGFGSTGSSVAERKTKTKTPVKKEVIEESGTTEE